MSFFRGSTKWKWQEYFPSMPFEHMVAMYVSDCMEYLEGKTFPPTTDQDSLVDGLRELKDMCMRKAGRTPLRWEKLKP